MKKFITVAALSVMTTPAFAGTFSEVPEMSAGAGVAAAALLAGVAAIIREKSKRK